MKKLRIALFTANYNHIPDGVSLTLNRLVEYLLSVGHDVLVFAPTIERPPIEHVGTLVPVNSFSIPGREEYRFTMGFSDEGKEKLRKFAPDIVHIASPDFLGCQALLYSLTKGYPVVSSFHTHFPSYLEYYKLGLFVPLGWKYMRWFHRNCIHTYVPSESMIEELTKLGIDKGLRIWARGIDLERFNPSKRDMAWRRSIGLQDDEILVSFVSRLVAEKEMDTLGSTFSKLHLQKGKVKTLIVGDGPARGELEYNSPDTVFTGFLSGDELARAYASSDIFMFPSVTETFGNVTLEAMASGVPAIVANAQGNKSLVRNDENGFLVAPKDINEFVRRINKVAENPQLRKKLSVNALNFAREFTWDKIFEKLVLDYEEAIHTIK
jgi:glycosyltransferase involved in cell wall biosynthesis